MPPDALDVVEDALLVQEVRVDVLVCNCSRFVRVGEDQISFYERATSYEYT